MQKSQISVQKLSLSPVSLGPTFLYNIDEAAAEWF